MIKMYQDKSTKPLLEVIELSKSFTVRKGIFSSLNSNVIAAKNISFNIDHGETLGLVGESGCGKTTVGLSVLRLIESSSGKVKLNGVDITELRSKELRKHRREMQMIFQDPYSSLNPRMRVGKIVEEPLNIFSAANSKDKKDLVSTIFERVGLQTEDMNKFPHEFSGGQRQRIGIGRALALKPSLIVCDEPVSSLDVSIQAQVINLLIDLQEELGLAYLFISHDLAIVQHISHRIAVMYLGQIVEMADCNELFMNPFHPYTKALLSAVPLMNPKNKEKNQNLIMGDLPSPINRPSGCCFHTRCTYVMKRCIEEPPIYQKIKKNHWAACHLN